MDIELTAGQDCVAICTDRVERHVAKVKQARIADHHVEADAEKHVDQYGIDDPDMVSRHVAVRGIEERRSVTAMISSARMRPAAPFGDGRVGATVSEVTFVHHALFRHILAEKSGWPEDQDDDQHRECKYVAILRANHAIG